MLDDPTPSIRPPIPRRVRDDGAGRPFHRSYETVDEDFDEVPLDDLRRQAELGGIDVADL